MEDIYNYCYDNGFILNNGCVLCYDGIMILKENYKPELLTELTDFIYNKYGLNLEFINKEMNKYFTDEELNNSQINKYLSDDVFKLASKINNNDVAKFCCNFIEKDKYKTSKFNIWYVLDENNVYKQVADGKIPDCLLNDISDSIMNIIQSETDILKPPPVGGDNYDKEIQQYTEKSKTLNNAYKKLGDSKFVKGCIDFLGTLYKDNTLEDKLDYNTSLIAFNNGYLYDIKTNNYRHIEVNDFISKTMDIKYNDNINKNKTEEIDKLLWAIFENDDIINHWLKIHGVSLFTNKREKLYILLVKVATVKVH